MDYASPPPDSQAAPGRPVGMPGWDYPVGMEGRNSLILTGAQVYSKLGEERYS